MDTRARRVSVGEGLIELQPCQFCIKSVLGHQALVGAGGDDAALVHDHDAIGFENGGEAMSDDQCMLYECCN